MAPVNPRPRSYAEHPAGSLAPKPANDNVLGSWENGVFRFASPQAKEKWRRKSYEQGVGEETWHHGKAIDSKSAAIVQAGFGGANPGLYQAPDGTYRLMNAKTIESHEARDHRNKYLTGKTIDQIAAANAMPGADEWVAKGKGTQGAANDNAADVKPALQLAVSSATPNEVAPAATVTGTPPALAQKTDAQADAGSGRTFGGRFAAMQGAQKSADTQNAKDLTRIGWNAILGNSGDELRAAYGAAGAVIQGKSFSEAYDSGLPQERAESAAAQERQGLAGTGVEILTSFIPFVGDASGALADFKDWKEHGDDWGWRDYGLVALGLIPEVPSRKQLKNGKKLVDGLADEAKSAWKGDGDELLGSMDEVRKADIDKALLDSRVKKVEQTTFDPKTFFPKDENEILTQKQALNLSGEKVGLVWVLEPETHIPHAAAYEREAAGYLWSKKHNMPAKPTLRWDNPDGDDLVKFDHLDPTPDATYLVLVDSKADTPPAFRGAEKTASADLRRQVNAVRQNNAVARGPKMKIRYDLPDEPRVRAMKDLIDREGYADDAIVTLREASKEAQDKFKKLRKTE